MQVINSSASQELDIVPEDEIIKQSVRIHKDVTNQNPAKSTLSVPGMGDSQGRSPSGGKKLTYKGKTLRPDKTGSDFNKKSFFKLFSSTKYFGQDDDSHQQDVAENSATLLKNLEEIYERRKNQEVLQDQVLSKEQQELDNLLISMMLCHEATKKEIQIEANNKYNMTKQKISIFDYQGQSREEHSIVLLAHLLGYTFRQLPTYDGQYSSFECGIMVRPLSERGSLGPSCLFARHFSLLNPRGARRSDPFGGGVSCRISLPPAGGAAARFLQTRILRLIILIQ